MRTVKTTDAHLCQTRIDGKPEECDIRPEWSKCNFAFEFSLEHLTEKVDGFYELVTLIGQSDKSGRVSFD